MTAGSAVARASVARHGLRAALMGMASLVLLIVVIVGGILSWPTRAATYAPSPVAVSDIPSDFLALYQRAAARFGIDWAVLAAVGKLECDHGRLQAPGCNPPGTVNRAGATGPMQFLGPTWRAGTPLGAVPAVGPPTSTAAEGYATDGDGDGIADVWNPADAIAAAARLLRANGAPGDYRRAVFAYNPSDAYVDRVLAKAEEYRGVRPRSVRQCAGRARVGGRARGTLHVQPRPADRPRRLDPGHAEPRAIGLDLRLLDVRPVGVRAGRHRHRLDDLHAVDRERAASLRRHAAGDGEGHPRRRRRPCPPGGYQPADLIFFGVDDGPGGHVALWLGDGQIVQCSSSGGGSNIRPLAGYVAPTGWVRWGI